MVCGNSSPMCMFMCHHMHVWNLDTIHIMYQVVVIHVAAQKSSQGILQAVNQLYIMI